MNKFLQLLILCLINSVGYSQEYYIKQYRVEKGLPSDIIKGCTQDQLGYFWIATDEGLVKFDGINFTSYRNAMHSNYAKGFFTTQDNKLLAFGDLDLIEIKNLGDTVIFESLYPVTRVVNDSSISYPKTIYQDKKGALWISESQSVVKFQDNLMTRYEFDLVNRTPQFLRAFSFFEDQKQNFYTSSFQGNVFRYDSLLDKFIPVDQPFPKEVEVVSFYNKELLIGSSTGLYHSLLLDDGGFTQPELLFNIPYVSYITQLPNGFYFISTRGNQHFIANLSTKEINPIPTSINNINHVYLSGENDILISGNEGLIVMRKNLFLGINQSVTDFIESITEDVTSGIMYYTTSTTLYSYNKSTGENKTVLEIPSGYFQSLLHTKEGIWTSNAFKVLLISEGKIKKQFDFSDIGRFITAITEDSLGNIWLTIPGSRYAYWIDRTHILNRVLVPLGNEGVINMIRAGNDGIYVASAGKESYLFYKPNSDSVFQNISIPVDTKTFGDFNVKDLIIRKNQIWLATSSGLLKFDHKKIERIEIGNDFTSLPIKSIQVFSQNKILLANAFGMILLDLETFQYDYFNESSGLLSNTITAQGLYVDENLNIWVGTAKGLCRNTSPLTRLQKTTRPKFTQTLVNGKIVTSGKDNTKIAYGSFISIQVSCITFPNEVTLQYRFGPNEDWKLTADSKITFSTLKAGLHTLEVRAKKNGPYSWSDSAYINLLISAPFWNQWWFYLLCFVGIGILITVSILGANRINKRRNEALQKLIEERTNALRKKNEELMSLNEEKNNLIGIVSHDLRNPLAQMMGLLSLIKTTKQVDDEATTYLGLMKDTIMRLNNLVLKILDIDAIESKKINTKIESLNISEVIGVVADRFAKEAAAKNITIKSQIPPDEYGMADKNYLEQVFDNLLSNAIKFSPHSMGIFLGLEIAENNIIFKIKDQGPGLTESDMQKIFGKYQKLSARPTGGETSTGLGLSITKKFVEAMNGEIWCESEPENGAIFFVSLKRSFENP